MDPSTVRELVRRDKSRSERFERVGEHVGAREIRNALEAGTEVSRLSPLSVTCWS